jgi:hypothetical protein
MDLYHLRQRLHVIASSWDYHGGAESRVSVRGNSGRFIGHGGGDEAVVPLLRQELAHLLHVSGVGVTTLQVISTFAVGGSSLRQWW